MNQAIDQFCSEIGGAAGAQLRAAIAATETEAVSNVDARRFLAAISWILEQPRTPVEKLEAIEKLLAMPRGAHVLIPSAQKFFGWRDA
jgi:hypothetical protein